MYVVKGAGVAKVNGIYSIYGMKNERPYYQKEGAALWFFKGNFLSSPYTGWYLSKHVGTSESSAANDYYTAYTKDLLPPSGNWVTRGINPISAFSGCGVDPAPIIVEGNIKFSDSVVVYPELILIRGAGSEEVNGYYNIVGTTNGKPCYKAENGTSLFYFYSSIFPISQYNGWYISKVLNSSQLSAKDDYYSAYVTMPLPPSTGWTTRQPGLMPSSGCGMNPPPIVEIPPSALKPGNIPIAVQSIELTAAAFEQQYKIHGKGKRKKKLRLPVLWYFTATVFPISTFTGWYISSELSSSSLSGNSDYYSAYVQTPFPPQFGWKTRMPKSITGGIGISPAPTISRVDVNEEENATTAELFNLSAFIHSDFMPYFPGKITISNAGNESVDGIYEYCDWFNERPYYIQQIEEESHSPHTLAYFTQLQPPVWGISDFNLLHDNSEYVSKENTKIPPEAGWSRSKGISPAPSVALHSQLKLIRICIHYQTEVFIISCPITSTVKDVLLQIQSQMNKAVKLFQLAFQERILESNVPLTQYKIQNGFHLHLVPIDASSLVTNKKIKKILIIGGGPVGLWSSIILKLLAPHCNVTVKEKRLEYKRNHALRIEPSSLECLRDIPALLPLYEVAVQFCPRTRTSIVEKELSQLACSLGVTLCYDNEVVANNNFEEYDTVLSCDGARSSMRKLISSPQEFKVEKTLGSLLQIKFEAIGQVSKASGTMEKFLQNLPAKQQFFTVLPANFDPETNTTPITIFSLINLELWKQLSVNKSSVPLVSVEELKEHLQTSEKLCEDIQAILLKVCPDGIVESSLQISVLPASYHIASTVCGHASGESKTPIFLLGDAAMGLSLEKGLNFGWQISTAFLLILVFSECIDEVIEFYKTFFERISNAAVAQLQSDYTAYQKLVAKVSIARSILKRIPFVN